jgi:hypothetical protein
VRRRVLPALLCLFACSAREAPQPRTRVRAAPEIPQEQPPAVVEDPAAVLELVDVELRTGRIRVGEAVRLHISAWRASEGPGLSPTLELVGPAKIERVGEEIIEERDGRVRERVDFAIEPLEPGEVAITALVATPTGEQRHELTVIIAEALPEAELAKLLATRAGQLERGRALAKQGDYPRAIEVFNLALEQQRDDPLVLGELGWAAFLAGDQSLARRATREALRHQTVPEARGALLYNLGRIAEALGREDEAVAAYRRSLSVRPDSEPVRLRLRKLEAGRPAPSCAAPSCPLTPPVDAIRACELIEEEGCPLFRQRGACSCDAEKLGKLDAIGPWRLLTLSERDEQAGVHQVYVLLADAASSGELQHHVFAPLPGSQLQLRGGVRAAERIEAGELELLRIDFDGTVEQGLEQAGVALGWTLLCAVAADQRPVCAAPLLSRHEGFVAPIAIDKDGSVSQTIESGTAPSRGELDRAFPNAGMHVLTRKTPIATLLARPE